jgi:uncharacterized DUF497 family protein
MYFFGMKVFNWSIEKNRKLWQERNISFEDVVIAIDNGSLLDVCEHPNKEKYPQQKLFVVEIGGYAYLVPFVENNTEIYLKTVFPSRKATRDYLGGHNEG